MKRNIKKIWNTSTQKVTYAVAFATVFLLQDVAIVAAKAPEFDNSEAQSTANGWLGPATTFALWAIPAVTTLTLIVSGIMWLLKDEEEQENKPFKKRVKRILTVAVICESVSAILKIVGIAS